MEQHDFINLYIQNLVKEVEELTKTKVLLTAKEAFKIAENEELKKKLAELEVNSAKEKDEVAATWQLALTEKDEEVTKIQHEMADMRRQLNVKNNELSTYIAKVDGLKQLIEEKEAQVEGLKRNVGEKELVIANLNKPVTNSKEAPKKRIKKMGTYVPLE